MGLQPSVTMARGVVLLLVALLSGLARGGDTMLGGGYDENGCCTTCGYSWCDSLGECIQPWVTECITNAPPPAPPPSYPSKETDPFFSS